jgi:hypothetical protein
VADVDKSKYAGEENTKGYPLSRNKYDLLDNIFKLCNHLNVKLFKLAVVTISLFRMPHHEARSSV